MDALIAEPADAPNPAIAPWFQVGHYWRGVGDPRLSPGASWHPAEAELELQIADVSIDELYSDA
jgi:hypothetical protein